MFKVLFGVLSGVFVASVIYELINRANPEFITNVEEFVCCKIQDQFGVNFDN